MLNHNSSSFAVVCAYQYFRMKNFLIAIFDDIFEIVIFFYLMTFYLVKVANTGCLGSLFCINRANRNFGPSQSKNVFSSNSHNATTRGS